MPNLPVLPWNNLLAPPAVAAAEFRVRSGVPRVLLARTHLAHVGGREQRGRFAPEKAGLD